MPSLLEIYESDFKDFDDKADLEDMSFIALVLLAGVRVGSIDLGGKQVRLQHINPEKTDQIAVVDGTGLAFEFSNEDDIFEPR